MPNLLRVKRDGERNFGYTPRIRSCYGLNSRDELENSYQKDTVLFETASDHLLMTGFAAAGVAWRLVMFLSWHEQMPVSLSFLDKPYRAPISLSASLR